MTVPFPHAILVPLNPSKLASHIFGHYVWLARWSDEIGTDTDLDLKKLAQLAFVHCREFSAIVPDTPSPEVLRAIDTKMRLEGIVWPPASMASDLAALKAGTSALFIFVRDNVPAARNFSTRAYSATGDETDESIKVPKTQAIANEVAKLRILFGA